MTDRETMEKIEALYREYEAEVLAAEDKGLLTNQTVRTYLLHSRNFVKWCKGQFEPGCNKKRG